jgi:hypothetical protein
MKVDTEAMWFSIEQVALVREYRKKRSKTCARRDFAGTA